MLTGMTKSTQVNDADWQRIKKEIKKFKGASTMVGYPTGMTTLLLTKAYANEYGTSRGIPSRPFMRQTFERVKNKVKNIIAKELNMIYAGSSTAKISISRLGEWYVGEVKRTFKTGNFVPNDPKTVKSKRSSKPLIDTGELRNSVTHKESI